MQPSKRILPPVLLLLLLAGCARDPAWLVERTLAAREKALALKDLKGYVALFHPGYRYQEGQTDTVLSWAQKKFAAHDSIGLTTSNTRITFEENGEIARVVQDFELKAEKNGKVFRTSGTEQFLLKRKKSLLKTEYLFYQGLGI